MELDDYRLILIVLGFIGVLLILTPAFATFIRPGEKEPFSELYLLDSNHMIQDYPYNIEVSKHYSIYLNVGDQLGSSAYYVLYVKIGNETDSLPNNFVGTPSSFESVCEYRFVLENNCTWTTFFDFCVSNAEISTEKCEIRSLQINNNTLNITKIAIRTPENNTCEYTLLYELWAYDPQTGLVEFNNRYVSLRLNIT